MQQEQQRGERRQEEFFKLLARTSRGERFRLLREQRRRAFGPLQLFEFEFFQALALFEPHLEIAADGDQKTKREKGDAHGAGRGGGVAGHHGAHGADHQQEDPVEGSDLSDASFHVQLSSRSSNSSSPNASEARR